MSEDYELAVEETDVFNRHPHELWRVTSWRVWRDQRLRHTNWFCTERAAHDHAKWVNNGRGEVIAVSRYVRSEPEEVSGE